MATAEVTCDRRMELVRALRQAETESCVIGTWEPGGLAFAFCSVDPETLAVRANVLNEKKLRALARKNRRQER